jgi:hypothetical protein
MKMNVELKPQSENDILSSEFLGRGLSTPEIIKEYQAISIGLSLLADYVPDTEEKYVELTQKETDLLDRQAALIETAISRPIRDLHDAKAILTLWHHEVVQSRSLSSLTAADELVNSVFKYFENT